MFSNEIAKNNIPPNFLNSILTNSSLYDMFKNDFDNNSEYFRNIEKKEYLRGMLDLIEETLFSRNIFHIYNTTGDLDEATRGKLKYIKNFYDDFLLEEFKKDPSNILKTKLFRGLEFAKREDEYASSIDEFNDLYKYIFDSIDYQATCESLCKDVFKALEEDGTISITDYTLLSNYVKNNIYGHVDMDIVTSMLKRHAYKTNHIFEREVVTKLVDSVVKSYTSEYGFNVEVEFLEGLESKEMSEHDCLSNTIRFDYELVDEFISLNYTMLFEYLFYELEFMRLYDLITKNRIDYATLNALMTIVIEGLNIDDVFNSENYKYIKNMRSDAFLKTLKFFMSFGVDLFDNYINAQTRDIDIDFDINKTFYSKKECSIEERFELAFCEYQYKEDAIKKYHVLGKIYDVDGKRKKVTDIIKDLFSDNREFLEEYMHSRIIDPDSIIDDVSVLSKYKSDNEDISKFIESELKYIYVDSFYYSVDSYIKLLGLKEKRLEEYIESLMFKIRCLNDLPITHRFIDEAIIVLEDAQQNY